MTTREEILAKRAGYAEGLRDEAAAHLGSLESRHCYYQFAGTRARVEKKYPLPTVSVPRIVVDPWGMAWKFEDGEFWYSLSSRDLMWVRNKPDGTDHELTTARVKLWADLLEHPIEEKPEEPSERAELRNAGEFTIVYASGRSEIHRTSCAKWEAFLLNRGTDSVACTCRKIPEGYVAGPNKSLYRELCERENAGAGESGGLLHVPSSTESKSEPLAKRREIL